MSHQWFVTTSGDIVDGFLFGPIIGVPNGLVPIGMFGMFGKSIALANAHQALKDNADFITLSNDEDGVAHALSQYLHII